MVDHICNSTVCCCMAFRVLIIMQTMIGLRGHGPKALSCYATTAVGGLLWCARLVMAVKVFQAPEQREWHAAQ